MSKLELHRHHKLFLALCGVVFLGAIAGGWFTWQECKELDDQAKSLSEQVGAAKSKINAIDDLEKEVIILRENVQEYVRVLPSNDEVNEFYRTLNEFQRDSGARLYDVKPQPQRTKLASSAVFDKAEYKLSFRATYAQFLQFISKIENHQRFLSISTVKMTAAQQDLKSSDPNPQHDCEVTVVTYVYVGEDINKGVTIPGLDHKKELLAEQISEARQDLKPEHFSLLSDAARRDPFVDPRRHRGMEMGPGSGLDDQRALVTKLSQRLQEGHALCDQMAGAGNVMRTMELNVQALNLIAEVRAQVDDANTRGVITDPTLKRDWDKKVVAELARLRQRLGSDSDNSRDLDRIRVRQTLMQMESAYKQYDYVGCVKAYEVVRSIGAGNSTDPDVITLQNRMEKLYVAAQTAVEFSKKKIEVTGHIVEPGHDSVAIVNHVVYREGDAIEDDLFLIEIHEDHLVFEFKGVPLSFDL